MSTRDLIDAIESGNSSAIQQHFQDAIMSRVAERLDTMRIEVAKNMFNESSQLNEYHIKGSVNGKKFQAVAGDVYSASTILKQNPHLTPDEAKAIEKHTETDEFIDGSDRGSGVYDGHHVSHYVSGGHYGEDPAATVRSKLGLGESADLHKDRLEQILADHDINSHVEGNTVHVDHDDVEKAQELVKAHGYDHKVMGGLNEVLSKKDPASKWIKDFVDSDDPKFKGKTKKERIKMALGAYYGAQRNESAELDEASRFNPDGSPKGPPKATVKFGKEQDRKTTLFHFKQSLTKDDLSKFKEDPKKKVEESSELYETSCGTKKKWGAIKDSMKDSVKK